MSPRGEKSQSSFTSTVQRKIEKFFGVADDDDDPQKSNLHYKWKAKSRGLQKSNIMFKGPANKTGVSAQYEMTSPHGNDDWLLTDKPSERIKREQEMLPQSPREELWNRMISSPPEACYASYMCSVNPSAVLSYSPEPGQKIDISFFDKPATKGGVTAAVASQDEIDGAPNTAGRQWRSTRGGLRIPKRRDVDCGVPQISFRSTLGAQSDVSIPLVGSKTETGDEVDGAVSDAGKYIKEEFFEEFIDNSNRHEVGIGLLGSCLGLKRVGKLDLDLQNKIDEMDANPYRPYFTYWVTFVQIVCFIVSVSVYGIATPGGAVTTVTGQVLRSSLAIELVSYTEDTNFWIGPRQADLIHLGAKYSPCMRDDENVRKAIALSRLNESNSGCCVRNDGSGCVQTNQNGCSASLSTWLKWTVNSTGPDGRLSGSVCGQDPRYCLSPKSTGAYKWPENIVEWPICESNRNVTSNNARHMTVPLVGRPCCIGVQGQCAITTREFCDFRRGYFHEEANLCSQVSCLSEICGMIPFYNPEKPDQFYRLWISLFIHAGIFQLLLSVIFQLVLMRDLEKFLGCIRIGIIYCVCGIAGSLGSAIFIPYHIEAGPSGSQFGLLAVFYVEIIQYWKTLENKGRALSWLIAITVILFAFGLLPMIDNYAHLIGFSFGFPLGFALMPNVWFGMKGKIVRIVSLLCCLLFVTGILGLLIVLFYVVGVYECPGCEWFNCIPLTPTFCDTSRVQIVYDNNF